ncbi:polysaccharide/polyol phosphate ABC transporter ATPase [Hyphomonas adhaerens MHS-3]|uniref:Polysaccharide/polyol phosphate ABC transporter ATPase n=1 Tax=Hyphomonas adhaerens MHS-3 TaxID=1280949 RepID=A0A069E6K9_9PROT|nr:ABC transporter ATP-binding protein [Hyphomonas adhaerens]KCZ85708.1 polysaccharide/polyol phosphate ABC transporter ATPase [Hyphomonas adhaerens MHS-3]
MSSDLPDHAIHLQGVSKHYLIYKRPEDRLKQMIMPKLRRVTGMKPRKYFTDFAAVHDVDFTVERGETVGIIGRNGSGKSTLLQMICGILQPSSGSVEVNGRIAALLELGAGFNADFTGRENVFLNAAILGLTREETEARFDSIARFADIGIFIDQPVKTYSSGMYVRLAFAVAINVDPDILVVDEALSVGDEAFQRKCFARIEQIRESGATILFVSHSAQTIVQLCDRAILMDGGSKLLDGEPKPVVQQYQRLVNADPVRQKTIREEIITCQGVPPEEPAPPAADVKIAPSEAEPEAEERADPIDPSLVAHPKDIENTGIVEIFDVSLETEQGTPVNLVEMGQRMVLRFQARFNDKVDNTFAAMAIRTIAGLKLFGASTRLVLPDHPSSADAGDVWDVRFSFNCPLTPGVYFFTVAVGKALGAGAEHHHRIQDALAFRVKFRPDLVATGFVDAGITPLVSRIERSAA